MCSNMRRTGPAQQAWGLVMSFRGLKAVLLACGGIGALVSATVDANAGGFAIREQSVYGQGTSFAGIAAGGDLSGMFWNPAVMTQFAGIQSSSSYTAIFPYAANSPSPGSNCPSRCRPAPSSARGSDD
jgi:long-chain fatty acid transport protein